MRQNRTRQIRRAWPDDLDATDCPQSPTPVLGPTDFPQSPTPHARPGRHRLPPVPHAHLKALPQVLCGAAPGAETCAGYVRRTSR